jgi:hypothetical protein
MFARPVLNFKSTDPQNCESLSGNERFSNVSSYSGSSQLPRLKGDEYPKDQLGDPENPTVLKNTLAKPKVKKMALMIHSSDSLKPRISRNPNFDFEIMGRELKLPDVKRKIKMGNPTKNIGPGSYKRKSIKVDLGRDSLGRDSMGNSQTEDLRKFLQDLKDQNRLPMEETLPKDALLGNSDCLSDFGDSEENLEIPVSDTPETHATAYKTIN